MQLKTAEIQATATGFTGFKGDACLCDKCFRFIDRRAKSIQNRKQGSGNPADHPDGGDPNSGSGPLDPDDPYAYDPDGGGFEGGMTMKKCVARNCNREVCVTRKGAITLGEFQRQISETLTREGHL